MIDPVLVRRYLAEFQHNFFALRVAKRLENHGWAVSLPMLQPEGVDVCEMGHFPGANLKINKETNQLKMAQR